MNIAHVISSMHPDQGGPPAVALRIAAAQRHQGHSVSLISYDLNESDEKVVSKVTAEFDDLGFGTDHWVRLKGTNGKEGNRLLSIIKTLDFVHIHGVWGTLPLRVASMAYKQGVPYTITPHGMLDPWCMRQKALKKKIGLILGYRKMLNRANFLHVLNFDEGELMKPLGLSARRITIPNGVFLNEIDPLPDKGLFREAYPQIGKNPFVLFLSRLHYKKGLDYLADAFSLAAEAHPDAWLVVAGPDGGALKAFEEQIQSLGIADRVLLTGPIYGEAKYHALVDANCFCLPSRQEGFSIAITEALACGRPVVITENCHFPEVAEVGAGHVCPLSGATVGQALIEVLGDPGRAEAMGTAGRALIEERFTWPKIAERCLKAYRGEI